jgi:hypothetical protein
MMEMGKEKTLQIEQPMTETERRLIEVEKFCLRLADMLGQTREALQKGGYIPPLK